ncbi:tetratricopeptide repeat protein [Pseudonocardia phyllosphaerae]|uniref:tetratricopeptide repeat protein n=1 Tax=Pseudonocardia phyllosphaerae TaxID=3390502 RepID=UPI00397CD04D
MPIGDLGNLFTGSPFLRESAAVERRSGGGRGALRERHDRAATAVRAAARDGDGAALTDATRRLEEILAGARRDLGPADADTLVVEGSLAVAYLLGDDETRGLALAARAEQRREQVFGPDHPITLAAADALAAAHRVTGRPEEAVRRYEDVLTRRARVLGDAHPDTLTSRTGLALARADDGDLRGAVGLLAATAGTAQRVLAPDHPVLRTITALLTECRAALADAQRASDPRELTAPMFFEWPTGRLPALP